ncbi:MAG: signal peptidase II [Pseudolabrys sp.]|nr:signal peptidase II [Pseudolabrys sp.]
MNLAQYLRGPYTIFGLSVAAVAGIIDQASKLYLLFVYDLANNPTRVAPFLDFVLTRNTGISYGLFSSDGALWPFVLLAFKVVAVVVLWAWLAKAEHRFTALSLGLIIGGAVGNAIDRAAYGWVMDFVFFHGFGAYSYLRWYVFNLADVAIVAGVIGLLYESFAGERAAKAP